MARVVEQEPAPAVTLTGFARGAVNVQAPREDLATVHVVNYDYDTDKECTRVAENVTLTVRLPFDVTTARIHRPGLDDTDVDVAAAEDGFVRIDVRSIGVYAIAELPAS